MKFISLTNVFQKKQIFVLFILLVSISLLIVALPRFRASMNHIPVDTVIDRLNARKGINVDKIPGLIDITLASIDLDDSARYWDNLSTLVFSQIKKQGEFSSTGRLSLVKAKKAVEESLMRSPGNSFLWYRLAVIETFQHAAPEKIVEALLMSILTGPHEPGFMLNRLRFCLMFFSSFNQDDLGFLTSQVLAVWNMSEKDFVKIIQQDHETMDNISMLLKNTQPQILEEMVSAVEKTN